MRNRTICLIKVVVLLISSIVMSVVGAERPIGEAVWHSGRAGSAFSGAIFKNVRLITGRDGTPAIRLRDNEYRNEDATDLLLHFNGAHLAQMFYGRKYSFVRADVILDRLAPFWGDGALKFLQPSQLFVFKPNKGALLAENLDMGSFTIEFFIFPYSNYDNEEIFAKYGTYMTKSGLFRTGGIRALFKQGRVAWQFKNFFRDSNGKFYDYQLLGRGRTLRRRWQHVAVTYDHFSGKLTKWVDGVEDSVIWATDSGRYGGSPLIPAFPENLKKYPVVGASYLGKLDELRVSRVAKSRFNITRYSRKHGVVVSRVFDMGMSGSRIKSIKWKQFCPAGSVIFLEYRVSETIFLQNSSELAWRRISNGATLDKMARSGRYVQWRARLIGVQRGRYSPVLNDVRIVYEKSLLPLRPVGLRVVPGDGKIYLRWTGNGDRVDGYRIYIGTEKGEYLHPVSPITVPLGRLDARQPEYVVYGLENDRLYYISIVAYVTRGQHLQSPFSREVYARPSVLYTK